MTFEPMEKMIEDNSALSEAKVMELQKLITKRDNLVKEIKIQEQAKKETVNHPNHYGGDTTFETIKVLKAWLSPEMYEGFLLGNSIKYQSRYKSKNGAEDLKKATWYQNELNKEYASGYFK